MSTNAKLLERRKKSVPPGVGNVAPIFIKKAEGSYIWDVDDNKYIDFCGGIGVLNVGHNHPKVVDAIKKTSDKYLHTCWAVAMYEEYLELAEKLNDAVPIKDDCMSIFFNSGAEAVENAVKISRYHTKRSGVIAFERGFHGRTLMGMTLTGKTNPYTKGLGPFAPEVYRLPYKPFFADPNVYSDAEVEKQCEQALTHLYNYQIEAAGIACIMAEPVLGEGGFYPLHPVAAKVLNKHCKEHGIMYVSDEVQSGFGRCGKLFAIENYDVQPDLITMAKSMGGGMVISGVTGRKDVMSSVHTGGLGTTFGGNPVSCAAALAVLEIIADEGLIDRANTIGQKVLATFQDFAKQHAFIHQPRALGAMTAFEFIHPESGAADPDKAAKFLQETFKRGLLAMAASGNAIRTLMPLNIEDDTLDVALNIMDKSLKAL